MLQDSPRIKEISMKDWLRYYFYSYQKKLRNNKLPLNASIFVRLLSGNLKFYI